MGAAGYELRTFEQCPNETQQFKADLIDLYVWKRGCTSVGVKLRKPHLTKEANYRFHKIEVKVLLEERQKLQYWRKQEVQLEEEFVLKEKKLNHFDALLREHVLRVENVNTELIRWAQLPIDKVVHVAKRKKKRGGEEIAELEICDLYRPDLKWKFSSRAYEDDKFEPLLALKLQKKIQSNTSYPQLLEQIFTGHVTL